MRSVVWDRFRRALDVLRGAASPRTRGSKYTPHQGSREKLRRRVGGFHQVRESDAWALGI